MSEPRNGSPLFYDLLDRMAYIHDKKSHDYASNSDPFGNYHFAGRLSKLFDNPDDAGFVGRIAEKLFRLANLENSGKNPTNESVEDTEVDICVIVTLWMADRRTRRLQGMPQVNQEAIKAIQEVDRIAERELGIFTNHKMNDPMAKIDRSTGSLPYLGNPLRDK